MPAPAIDIELLPPSRRLLDDAAPRSPPSFAVDVLLAASAGPYELKVEVMHDDRVVGTWQIDDNLRDGSGTLVSQAKAALHVCGSPCGNPRETGAFLAIANWWVSADSPTQIAELYETLGRDVLDRLASLLGESGPRPGASARQILVLYLLDVRRRDRRMLSLPTLEASLLRELAKRPPLIGLELRVAHGHGTGSAAIYDTMPLPPPATRAVDGGHAHDAQSATVTWWPKEQNERP